MRARGDMREVELVEPDEVGSPRAGSVGGRGPDERSSGPADAPAGPRRRPWLPGRRGALLGGVVVLVLAVVSGVGAVRDHQRLARLAEVPGVLAPVEGPVTRLWAVPDGGGTALREVAGRLVGTVTASDGSTALVALDPGTGAEVWRTPVGAPGDVGHAGCSVPGAPFPAVPAGAAPVAVCVVVDETETRELERGPDDAAQSVVVPTRARLLVVDAVTGDPVSDVPVDPGTQVTGMGTDVLLTHVGADGLARVTRADPRSGEVRWTFTAPETVLPDSIGLRYAPVRVFGDVVVVDAGPVWVLDGDGELLRTWPDPEGSRERGFVQALTPDARLLARQSVTTGGRDGGGESVVLDVDTGREVTVPGYALGGLPDDGSLGDHVLVRSPGDGVVAVDLASGEVLWSRPDPDSSGAPIVLAGRVVLLDGGTLRALDGRTGTEAWATELPGTVMSAPVTDGRVVLVPTHGPSGGVVMTAYGLDDGRSRWTSTVDETQEWLHLVVVDGRLFAWGDDGVVHYGEGPAGG